MLRAVARNPPSSLDDLAKISGIGPTSLELYGEEVLAVLESVSSWASRPSGVETGARQAKSRHT